MSELFLNVPLIGQNIVLLPDGNVDPDHATDCGEACVSAVALGMGYGAKLGFTPGEVRRLIRGGWRDFNGVTNGQDLVNGLWRVGQIPAHVRDSTILQLHVEMSNAFQKRLTGIILGNWDGAPHWICMVAVNKDGLVIMDPWQPEYRRVSWQQVMLDYLGEYVHVDRTIPNMDDIPF